MSRNNAIMPNPHTKSRTTPANLVVTLTISDAAPKIRLNLREATIVGLACVGYSVDQVSEMIGLPEHYLQPTIDHLCEQFECDTHDQLWRLLENEPTYLLQ
jgi:hypothetical protein